MQQIELLPVRERVIACLGELKKSWVMLGSNLYTAWKDKLYYDWGYDNWEVYCAKELNLLPRQAQAVMKNFFFLENERPYLVQLNTDGKQIPELDSVSAVRNISSQVSKKISGEHYGKIQDACFEELRPAKYMKNLIRDCKEEFENKSAEEKIIEEKRKSLDKYLSVLSNLDKEFQLKHLDSGDEKIEAMIGKIQSIIIEKRDSLIV